MPLVLSNGAVLTGVCSKNGTCYCIQTLDEGCFLHEALEGSCSASLEFSREVALPCVTTILL